MNKIAYGRGKRGRCWLVRRERDEGVEDNASAQRQRQKPLSILLGRPASHSSSTLPCWPTSLTLSCQGQT